MRQKWRILRIKTYTCDSARMANTNPYTLIAVKCFKRKLQRINKYLLPNILVVFPSSHSRLSRQLTGIVQLCTHFLADKCNSQWWHSKHTQRLPNNQQRFSELTQRLPNNQQLFSKHMQRFPNNKQRFSELTSRLSRPQTLDNNSTKVPITWICMSTCILDKR
jgi:hypothetical protein